jgi:PDDEXK-like domain of unknown function (DUF3799)
MQTTYKDGVYDITNEQYHASAGISRSRLMLLDKSPYHYWYEVLSGEAEPRKATPAMNMGNAFHTLLLEPKLFDREYIVKPKIEKLPPEVRLKDVGKEIFEQAKVARKEVQDRNTILLEEFESQASGKIQLSESEFEETLRWVNSTKKHDLVNTLLDDGVFEQSIFWTDKETGLQFKARPDIWTNKMVVDVKTAADAATHKFKRSAIEDGYYLQAAMIYEACQSVGRPFEVFTHLVIEKKAPHVPKIFLMNDTALQYGIDQFNTYKKKLKFCFDSNKWDGYPVQELSVPKYASITTEEEVV